MNERLRELVGELRSRSRTCKQNHMVAVVDNRATDAARLSGKASAYGHAAEMVENLIKDMEANASP